MATKSRHTDVLIILAWFLLSQLISFQAYAEHKEDGNNAECRVTRSDILGPYFKEGAPFSKDNRTGLPTICVNSPAHNRLVINGSIRILADDSACGKPVQAVLDVWQANADGIYSDHLPSSPDYGCRSRVNTNKDGLFTIQTIFPGRYNDFGYRPAHIHFRVTPVDDNGNLIGETLTTQLYFARDTYLRPRDSCDRCASGDPSLIMPVTNEQDVKTFTGTWNVLLDPRSNSDAFDQRVYHDPLGLLKDF